MKPNLYEAASTGKIEPFEETAKDELGSIVTYRKNTVLHLNITSQAQNGEAASVSTEFVKRILEMCPSLLVQVNAKGDAPLHLAAKYGHAAVVDFLIEFAKKQPKELESDVETVRHMLGMTNEDKNTALHEAVQHQHHRTSLDVVRMLMKADPDVPYSPNGSGETPLYMAAARGSRVIVAEILKSCPSAAHEGPNGRTALHAAVRSYAATDISASNLQRTALKPIKNV